MPPSSVPRVLLLSVFLIGCRPAGSPSSLPSSTIRLETPAFALSAPSAWNIRIDGAGVAELTDPNARGPWSDLTIQIIPLADAPPACTGETRVVKADTACLTTSSGAGSHSSGTMVEARVPHFLLRVRENAGEGTSPRTEAELRTFTLPILESFEERVARAAAPSPVAP